VENVVLFISANDNPFIFLSLSEGDFYKGLVWQIQYIKKIFLTAYA